MFAKLFIVALAIVCASAGLVENSVNTQPAVYPLAYSAGVVPTARHLDTPITSYSVYPVTPVSYSGIPTAYRVPAARAYSVDYFQGYTLGV